VTSAPPEDPLDPGLPDDEADSWEPPSPALGGPGQLVATLLVTLVVGVALLGTLAAVSWLFR
jgi:hypothetical protein